MRVGINNGTWWFFVPNSLPLLPTEARSTGRSRRLVDLVRTSGYNLCAMQLANRVVFIEHDRSTNAADIARKVLCIPSREREKASFRAYEVRLDPSDLTNIDTFRFCLLSSRPPSPWSRRRRSIRDNGARRRIDSIDDGSRGRAFPSDATFPENACDARARARQAADSSGVAGRGERIAFTVASNQLLDKTKHSRAAFRDCDCDCDPALSLSHSRSRLSVFLFPRLLDTSDTVVHVGDDHKDVGGKFTLRFIGRCTM